MWRDTNKTSFTIFSWISKTIFYKSSFLLWKSSFHVGFLCPERQERSSLPFIFILEWQDTRVMMYLAPLPVSLEHFSSSLTASCLHSALLCLLPSQRKLVLQHLWSLLCMVNHGLLSYTLIYLIQNIKINKIKNTYIRAILWAILDKLEFTHLKSIMLKNKQIRKDFWVYLQFLPHSQPFVSV